MITAAGIASALTPTLAELVEGGADREVLALEVVDADAVTDLVGGDLALVIGARTLEEVLDVVTSAADAAGLVVRRRWAEDAALQDACRERRLALLSISDDVSWSSVHALAHAALDTASGLGPASEHAYSDLFDMADQVARLVDAAVTIEDPHSRVLAYSTGQLDVDDARMSTIVGRQVPRAVREHFRSLGVFRALARSDDPILVPSGRDGVKARYVIPVRAGGEWLGSIWAVTDDPPADRAQELRAAAEVIALYLLRLRTQGELYHQLQRDQVRALLRGEHGSDPKGVPVTSRVAALLGPADGPADGPAATARCELWHGLVRRRGWGQPRLADLDGTVYAVLDADGSGPGSWTWLRDLALAEAEHNPTVRVLAGRRVASVAELGASRSDADELARLSPTDLSAPVVTIEDAWPSVVISRAVTGLSPVVALSPLTAVTEHEQADMLVDTLEAIIDYWGEPQRAARSLGVHPNTVRHRSARLAGLCPADLADPAQRLAIRLEIARLRATG